MKNLFFAVVLFIPMLLLGQGDPWVEKCLSVGPRDTLIGVTFFPGSGVVLDTIGSSVVITGALPGPWITGPTSMGIRIVDSSGSDLSRGPFYFYHGQWHSDRQSDIVIQKVGDRRYMAHCACLIDEKWFEVEGVERTNVQFWRYRFEFEVGLLFDVDTVLDRVEKSIRSFKSNN